jgi:hypothetical protein
MDPLTKLKKLKQKTWSQLMAEYETLTDDESRRNFLDKLKHSQQKSLLKLQGLKRKDKTIPIKIKKNRGLGITKAVLFGSNLKAVEGLYTEKGWWFLFSRVNTLRQKVSEQILNVFRQFETKLNKQQKALALPKADKPTPPSLPAQTELKEPTNLPQTKAEDSNPIITVKEETWDQPKKNSWLALAFKLVVGVGVFSGLVYVSWPALHHQTDFLFREAKKQLYADTQDYGEWSKVFVNAPETDPEQDPDLDGLTNEEEFWLKTDPMSADQNQNGLLDGADTLANIHPANEQLVHHDGLSKNLISYRLQKLALDQEKQNHDQKVMGVSSFRAEVDPTVKGSLAIPSVDYDGIPIAWNLTGEESDFEAIMVADLIHTKDSALPGYPGRMHLYGFNSQVENSPESALDFDRINELEPRDEIFIQAKSLDGSIWQWKYLIVSRNLYVPGDSQQFNQDELSELQLVTLDSQSGGAKIISFNARFISEKKMATLVTEEPAKDSNVASEPEPETEDEQEGAEPVEDNQQADSPEQSNTDIRINQILLDGLRSKS